MNINQIKIITFISQEQFQEELNKQVIYKFYYIKIQTVPTSFNIKDIELSPIYDNCIDLKIKIKGQWYNQNDLDTFLSQILLFKQIKSLDIFFFNKRVKYIDKLLQIASKINNVSLSLKHFKKLYLKNEYVPEINTIKQLQINIQDAFFLDIETRKRFADYLGTLTNLETLTIKQFNEKKGNLIELFRKIQPTTRIELSNQIQIETIERCDQIFEQAQKLKSKINITDVNDILIREYLRERNILDTQKYQTPFYLNHSKISLKKFSLSQFRLIDKVKSFINDFVELSKTQKIIVFHQNQTHYFVKYFLRIIYHLFDEIKVCNHYYNKYDYPYIDKYFKNSCIINIFSESDFFDLLYIPNLVNFQIKLKIKIYDDIPFLVKKSILQQEYLIFLQITCNSFELKKRLNEDKTIQIVHDRGQTFLRYLVFQKFIQDLIPLPQQIFYDLASDI